jgi:hypothetical protein
LSRLHPKLLANLLVKPCQTHPYLLDPEDTIMHVSSEFLSNRVETELFLWWSRDDRAVRDADPLQHPQEVKDRYGVWLSDEIQQE